jgi:hypothetical protein
LSTLRAGDGSGCFVSGVVADWPKLAAVATRSTEKAKQSLFMKSLRSQSLSDLDAEPPRVGVFELYSAKNRSERKRTLRIEQK